MALKKCANFRHFFLKTWLPARTSMEKKERRRHLRIRRRDVFHSLQRIRKKWRGSGGKQHAPPISPFGLHPTAKTTKTIELCEKASGRGGGCHQEEARVARLQPQQPVMSQQSAQRPCFQRYTPHPAMAAAQTRRYVTDISIGVSQRVADELTARV